MKTEKSVVQAASSRLVLASGSKTRRRMLAAVGLNLEAIPSGVDEAQVKCTMAAKQAAPAAVAHALAALKAEQVSRKRPRDFVIGADLVLVCNGRMFDKAADISEARANLRALSGKTHELICVAVVARDGAVIWHHEERPSLRMRMLGDADIDRYLSLAGEEILDSVGAYHLEGVGAQLFERVDGDFFSILGLPLLPLLAFLRGHDIVPAQGSGPTEPAW